MKSQSIAAALVLFGTAACSPVAQQRFGTLLQVPFEERQRTPPASHSVLRPNFSDRIREHARSVQGATELASRPSAAAAGGNPPCGTHLGAAQVPVLAAAARVRAANHQARSLFARADRNSLHVFCQWKWHRLYCAVGAQP